MNVFKSGMRAVKLVDSMRGWAEGCALSGMKVAFDVISAKPTDPNHSLIQQVQAAAASQGLWAPPAAAGAFAGQAHLGAGPGAGAGVMQPQWQLQQPQMLPGPVMPPLPPHMLAQYGQVGAGGPGAPRARHSICWRCGVAGHTVPQCGVPPNPLNPYPFKPAARTGGRP